MWRDESWFNLVGYEATFKAVWKEEFHFFEKDIRFQNILRLGLMAWGTLMMNIEEQETCFNVDHSLVDSLENPEDFLIAFERCEKAFDVSQKKGKKNKRCFR